MVESVVYKQIDHQKLDELYDNLWEQFEDIEITEDLPDELTGLYDSSEEEKKIFQDDFFEVYKIASEPDSGAKEKIEKLKEKYPQNPAIAYLHTVFLNTNKPDNYEKQIDEYFKSYPKLIFMQYKLKEYFINIDAEDISIEKSVEIVFGNRKIINVNELYEFFILLLARTIKNTNLELLYAVDMCIANLELNRVCL